MTRQKTVRRTYVPLTENDIGYLDLVRQGDGDDCDALYELTGIRANQHLPEARLLHAVVEAGMKAISQKAEEIGYQRLAEFVATDEESQRWKESRRARAAHRMSQDEAPW